MTDFDSEIDAALLGDESIPKEKVLLWIDAAAALSTLSKLYQLTGEGYCRIRPDLGKEVTCALIQRYLLECIREDASDHEEIQSRYEAAQTLLVWLWSLHQMEDTSLIIAGVVRAVTELYLASGEDVRTAIENGFLEHALETTALRPYFEHWSSDARLSEAWDRALEWGKAHPNYTWGLFQQLQRPK
jgi:hypothetical protein